MSNNVYYANSNVKILIIFLLFFGMNEKDSLYKY